MLVIDSSAVLDVLSSRRPNARLLERLGDDGDLHAPHLVDVKVLNVLRRLVRGGQLTLDQANDIRHDFGDLTISRYGHELLSDRMWALRDNVTAHYAAFVALSEVLGSPLITCDARLAAAPGVTAELFGQE